MFRIKQAGIVLAHVESREWNVVSPLRVIRVEFPCNEECPSVTKCQSEGCNLPREGTACSLGMNKAHALSVWHRVPVSSSSEGTQAYHRRTVSKTPGQGCVSHSVSIMALNTGRIWVQWNEGPGIFFFFPHIKPNKPLSLCELVPLVQNLFSTLFILSLICSLQVVEGQ